MYIVFGGGYSIAYVPWEIGKTQIDFTSDIISGVVPNFGSPRAMTPVEIQVSACVRNRCVSQYPEVDHNGYWEADFSGVIDITIGVHGYLSSVEGGNGSTQQRWQVYGYYYPITTK